MGRPAGWAWQPLGLDSDPVPGDPQAIGQEASHLASVASQISDQVNMLHQIAASNSDEVGKHAEKIRSAAGDLAGQLDKVVGRYQKVSSALTGWISELEQAQTMSLQALNEAEGPYKQLHQTVALPSGSHMTAQQKQQVQSYHNQMNQAQGELDAAIALLNRATSLRDEQGSYYAGLINQACDDGVKDSWWDQFKDWVSSVAWIIKDICTVIEVLATIAAVLAFILAQFVPGLDVLVDALVVGAFWATLAATTGRFLLAATGNGSWWDFAVDAFSCLTFGLGRVAGEMAEGLAKTAVPLSKAMMTSELADDVLNGTAKGAMLLKYAALTGEDVSTVVERLAPKLATAVVDGGKLEGGAKVLSSLGSLSKEGEAFTKLLTIGSRFTGSLADFSTAAKTLLTVQGGFAGVAGVTGISTLVTGGIELDSSSSAILKVDYGPFANWYESHLEIPTGGS
jgi:hypothetical protein